MMPVFRAAESKILRCNRNIHHRNILRDQLDRLSRSPYSGMMINLLNGEEYFSIAYGSWSIVKEGAPVFPKSFILRITREEWFKQVFMIKKYYPGVPRSWEEGGTFLLVRKAEKGDSFVGYGVLDRFIHRDLLPIEKREECEKMGWKGELVFGELYRFEPPLPIKDTVLGGTDVRGRCFHGYPLTQEQVASILNMARQKSTFCKID